MSQIYFYCMYTNLYFSHIYKVQLTLKKYNFHMFIDLFFYFLNNYIDFHGVLIFSSVLNWNFNKKLHIWSIALYGWISYQKIPERQL